MNKYFPSKKFSLILLSLILSLGIVFSYIFFNKKNQAELATPINTNSLPFSESLAKKEDIDTDGDGLKDWEELLWKTDFKIADTDGDGTNDGEEVKLNRNPLKANTAKDGQIVTDKIEIKIIDAREKIIESSTPLNNTEKISRELFAQYLNAKKDQPNLSQKEMQIIVNNILSEVPSVNFKIYSKGDISIIYKNNNDVVYTYANELAKAIFVNLLNETESINSITTSASEITNDEKIKSLTANIFQRFDPLIYKNKKTVTDLLSIPVPEILTPEHLKLLNAFEEIYESLVLMQNSANDPIILVSIKDNYSLSTQKLADSLLNIKEKLSSLEVVFPNRGDYGYQLFHDIINE